MKYVLDRKKQVKRQTIENTVSKLVKSDKNADPKVNSAFDR